MYKISIARGQIVRFKIICSIEEKLNNRVEQLKQFLVKRGYKEDHVDSKIEIALVLTYNPALNQLHEVLLRAHKHVLKSPRLSRALPSQARVAF